MFEDRMPSQPDGLILIDKPQNISSAEIGNMVKRRFRFKKVGHAGTLDPIGTGLLVICVNEGVKLSKVLSEGERAYNVNGRLGAATDTQDRTGQIISEGEVPQDEDAVREAILSFLGPQMQTPPMYSAKKHQGRELYKIARQGESVEREAVPVNVYDIGFDSIELPLFSLHVKTSKGFYVRTLCHDIGAKLGCGAYLEELRRTMHSGFVIEDTVALDELLDGGWETLRRVFLPLDSEKINIPRLFVGREAEDEIRFGRRVKPFMLLDGHDPQALDAPIVRAVSESGRVLALLERGAGEDTASWLVERGFSTEKTDK